MEKAQIKDDSLRFLRAKENITAVIATTSETAIPHAAVVYYFVDENFNFYFLTATASQKYKNLSANHQMAVAIGFGPKYVTIQGQGEATLLEKRSEEENQAIAKIYMRLEANDSTWPAFQLDKNDREQMAVFKFTPRSLTLLNLEPDNGLVVTNEDLLPII